MRETVETPATAASPQGAALLVSRMEAMPAKPCRKSEGVPV